ncbi:MAG: universal stress protein [Sphingomonadaceae bacterium]|nr:universal stress protein [Sphingomonadaceae bacterium]
MKSIQVHAGSDGGFESRLQIALDLTRRFNGHLTLVLPRPPQDYVAFDMFGGAHFIADVFDAAEKERDRMRSRIDEKLKVEGLPWDWQVFDGPTVDALLNAARLGDVMVMSLDVTGTGAPGHGRALVSDVVTASRTPVLAVPVGCKSLSFDRAMIAYDGGFEAANALRAALPMLSASAAIRITEVDAAPDEFPVTDAATYLSRHDICAEIAVAAKGDTSVEERLLAEARAWRPDFLVMGAYGHGRWRETLFGGVTRFLLGEIGVPVLLAH